MGRTDREAGLEASWTGQGEKSATMGGLPGNVHLTPAAAAGPGMHAQPRVTGLLGLPRPAFSSDNPRGGQPPNAKPGSRFHPRKTKMTMDAL